MQIRFSGVDKIQFLTPLRKPFRADGLEQIATQWENRPHPEDETFDEVGFVRNGFYYRLTSDDPQVNTTGETDRFHYDRLLRNCVDPDAELMTDSPALLAFEAEAKRAADAGPLRKLMVRTSRAGTVYIPVDNPKA